MSEKTKNVLMAVLATLFVGISVFWVGYRVHVYTTTSKVTSLHNQADKAKSAYQTKYDKLENQAITKGSAFKNQEIASISTQNGAYNSVSSTATKFFAIVENYSTTKQYKSRKDKAKTYATDDVLNNASLFGTDDSYKAVEALGLNSSFTSAQTWIEKIDGNNITALVRVKYTANYSGQPSGNGMILYEINFDTSRAKITSITQLTNSATA